jgi:lipopolysaccharide transport system permease protein
MRNGIITQRPFGLRLYLLVGFARSIWVNRYLAWEMAKRELRATMKGTILGIGWLILKPAIQTGAYIVIVSFIFSAKLGSSGSHFAYALYVLCGMAPWQFSTQVLQDAPTLIRSRIEILKQVIYPLEILPITSIVMASIAPLILFATYLLLAMISGELSWSLLLLPIPVALLLTMLLGTSWLLMVVGLVFVDIREIIGVIFGLIVYMSPVVLAPSMVTPRIWGIIELNPLSHIVICFRDVFEAQLHPLSWGIFAAVTAVSIVLGMVGISGAKRIFSEYG